MYIIIVGIIIYVEHNYLRVGFDIEFNYTAFQGARNRFEVCVVFEWTIIWWCVNIECG